MKIELDRIEYLLSIRDNLSAEELGYLLLSEIKGSVWFSPTHEVWMIGHPNYLTKSGGTILEAVINFIEQNKLASNLLTGASTGKI